MKKSLLVLAIVMAAVFARAQLLTPWKAPVECDIPTVTKLYGTQMSAKAVASTASQRSVKTITPTASQMWWGYFSESNVSSLDFSGNLGYSSAVTLNAAIMVEGSNSFVKGSTIKAVRFWLGDDLSAINSNLTVWISKSLPTSASAADYTQTIPKANISSRLNEVELTTPYDATSMQSGDKLYIGFSFSISGRAYPIMAGGTDMSGGFYYNIGSSWIDFVGEGYKNGNLALQLLLDGGTYPTNCASIDNLGQEVVKSGSSVSIPCKITNKGIDDITSLEFTVKDANGNTQTVTRTLSNSLALNSSTDISLSFNAASTVQKSDISVTVTKVNGVDNTLSASDGLKVGTGTLITVSSVPTVVPVVEEFTGTWCGYCPYGTVAMQKAHQQYGDEIVQIAIHSGDPMAVSDYSPVISAYCDGYPNATIDRQSTFHAASIPYYLTSAFNRVSQGMIELTAEWSDAGKTAVKFNTKSTFGYSDNNGQYGIALVLTEDGMTGTSSNWSQNNYLSGGSGNSDMQFWYNSPSTVSGLEYDHVAVAVWNALNGADGSIPSSFTADTPIEYNFTGDISSNTLIQDKTKLKAVALLIDRVSGKIVNAAQCSLSDGSVEGIEINETNFPDANFRAWVLSQSYGTDAVLTDAEIAAVTSISVDSKNIANLKGIEYFTALQTLYCYSNQLTTLDVTKNTALTYLNCGQNLLTALDVTKNTALTKLACNDNQLTTLDLSQNTALTELRCDYNQLTALDVTKNTALTSLDCLKNQLTSLDVSKNTALTGLDCVSNQLTALDISKNTALKYLWCGSNQLTTLDVTQNTALTELYCYNNQLTTLDLSQNTALTYLLCEENQLTSLDVTKNTALTALYCYNNQIKGTDMDALVTSLPTVSSGSMRVIYNTGEQNVMTTTQVAAAKAKGWIPYYREGSSWKEYAGSEEVSSPEAYAVLSEDNTVLTFYYDSNKESRGGMSVGPFTSSYVDGVNKITGREWNDYVSTITKVVFDATFADYMPTSTACWFYDCNALTTIAGIENLKTDNVTSMNSMLYGCSGLTSLDVSNFNTSNVTDMGSMFGLCSGLTSLDVSNFNTDKVTDMRSMFRYCSSMTSLDVSKFNTEKVTSMLYMFQGCSALTTLDVSNFNTNNVTNMSYMFSGCSGLISLDVSNFNTGNVTDMGEMFDGCSGLISLDVSNFNTGNVTDMVEMFYGCSRLISLDVSNFNTGNVTSMSFMFYCCSALTSLDVSNFNTSNVKDMSFMFCGCSALTSLDASKFNTSNVTDMMYMFCGCSSLTSLDVSKFNTSNVTDMSSMFDGCSGLTSLDVSNFNTGNVTDMGEMFSGCSSLTTIKINADNWNTSNVTKSEDMFYRCTKLVGGTGTTYDSNHTDVAYAHIDGGPSNPGYLTSVNAPQDNVTISAKSYTREYGEENPKYEYDVTEGTITSGTPEITCVATAKSPVGSYDIVISKGSVSNNEVALNNGTLTITKAPLTISGGTYTIKQGDTLPEFAAEYDGFKNGETSEVLTKQPVMTTSATSTSEPGTYEIAVSGAEAGNYEISYVTGTLTIMEADPVKVTAKSYTIEYGESIPAFEYSSEGAALSGVPEISCKATTGSAVGIYDIVISKGSVSNYNDTYVNGTLTITKAPLTISVGEYTRQEGEENPEFELTYSGFKNGETDGALTKQPTVKCIATKDSEPGEYLISIEGAEAENYDIRYAPGMLTVTAKPLPEITPIEGETTVSTEGLSEADLTDNVVNDVYYNVGEQGYDAAENSIVISEATNMAQITDKEPGSKDVRDGFNGIILKVGKGFGLITVSAKTSGNAQLVVQVGESGMPMIASRTEKGDVVVSYDVSEDTYVYIYAILGSSAAKLMYGDINDTDTDSSVRIYGITVSPGATGIRSVNGNDNGNEDAYYTIDGKKLDAAPKKGGIYVKQGRKVVK